MAKKESLIETWFTASTCHGLYEIYIGRNICEKGFWILLMSFSFGMAFWQIAGLTTELLSEPHYVKSLFPNEDRFSRFPTILVCNLNRATQSGMKSVGLTSKALAHVFLAPGKVYEYNSVDKSFTAEYMEQEKEWEQYLMQGNAPSNISEIFHAIGPRCEDIFLKCRWGFLSFNCCAQAYPVLNQFGKCYAIDPPTSYVGQGHPKQFQPGVVGGMKLYMSVDKANQYLDPENLILNNYFEEGQVVTPTFNPLDPRISNPVVLSAGTHSWIRLSNYINRFKSPPFRLFKPKCAEHPSLAILRADYSLSTCMTECKFKLMKKHCGCVNLAEVQPGNIICNGTRVRNCDVYPSYRTESFRCRYSCLLPCQGSISVDSKIHSVPYPGENFKKEIARRIFQLEPTTKRIRLSDQEQIGQALSGLTVQLIGEEDPSGNRVDQVTLADIFYPQPSALIVETAEKVPLFSFIGNIGGQLGLWLGISIATLFQGFYYVYRHNVPVSLFRNQADVKSDKD